MKYRVLLLGSVIAALALAFGCEGNRRDSAMLPYPLPGEANAPAPALGPAEVSLLPAPEEGGERSIRIQESIHVLSGSNLYVADLVNLAWRTPERAGDRLPRTSTLRIEGSGAIPAGRFNVRVEQPGARVEQLRAALQEAVRKAFAFEVRAERRSVAVLVLTAPDGQTKAPATGAGPPASARERQGDTIHTRLSGDDLILLADQLEDWLREPVVDETGLRSAYALHLTQTGAANMNEPPGLEELRAALREQVGLDLRPGRREIEFLVVRPRE